MFSTEQVSRHLRIIIGPIYLLQIWFTIGSIYNITMLEDKDPDEIKAIAEIAQNHGLDMEEAEQVKEIMDEEGLDEDDAVELKDYFW